VGAKISVKLSTLFFLGFGIALGLGLVFGSQSFIHPYQYKGSLINPPFAASDLKLTDQNGGQFQLSSLRGKVILLFFGYSSCPDVCPATLAKFKQVRASLGDQARETAFLFITVDPVRDTPAVLKTYLAKFDPSIVGLTGDRTQLTTVWKAYGVYQQDQAPSASLVAMVDHSSYVYVIDRAGNMRETFTFDDPITGITGDVKHLLGEGS
jgi:protein SCO1/2